MREVIERENNREMDCLKYLEAHSASLSALQHLQLPSIVDDNEDDEEEDTASGLSEKGREHASIDKENNKSHAETDLCVKIIAENYSESRKLLADAAQREDLARKVCE